MLRPTNAEGSQKPSTENDRCLRWVFLPWQDIGIPLQPVPLPDPRLSTWARWCHVFAHTADQAGILTDCTLWHLGGWHRKLAWRRLNMPSGRHLGSSPWRRHLLFRLIVTVLCAAGNSDSFGALCTFTPHLSSRVKVLLVLQIQAEGGYCYKNLQNTVTCTVKAWVGCVLCITVSIQYD